MLYVVFVLFVLFSLSVVISRIGKQPISIAVFPSNSSVYINNRQYNPGVVYLGSGSYVISAQKSGWSSPNQKITVTNKPVSVVLLLDPISHTAIDWLKGNKEAQVERESLAGVQASLRGLSVVDTNPIIKLLPYTDISGPFGIDYGYIGDDVTKVYLLISYSSPNGRQKAFEWIRSKGYDPTSFTIRYTNFTNPLVKNGGN